MPVSPIQRLVIRPTVLALAILIPFIGSAVAGEGSRPEAVVEFLDRAPTVDLSTDIASISRWDAHPGKTYPRDSLYGFRDGRLATTDASVGEHDLTAHEGLSFFSEYHSSLLEQLDWWKIWNQPSNRQPFLWQTYCDASVSGISNDGKVLECWLELNPHVRQALLWQNVDLYGDVEVLPYDQWDGFMKGYLYEAFMHYMDWLSTSATAFPSIPLPDPPANQEQLSDHQPAITALARIQAQVLYLQNIAHSLAVEIGGFVPWSLRHYYPDELEMLLSSESFFNAGFYGATQTNNPDGVSFKGYWPQEVTPAPPIKTFSFLVEQNILRSTHADTISRLLKWARENMYHYGGGRTAGNMYNHWQYRGNAPVSRMLEGTYRISPASSKLQSWAAGCHGVSFFFRETLRSVNIPVKPTWIPVSHTNGGHRTPVFTTINRMLSHGDDAFNVRFNIPSVDPDYLEPGMLLINQDKLIYWFNHYSNPDAGKNVGRQVKEIALNILPNALMDMYCEDLQNGLPHIDGAVAAYFSSIYSVSQLESKSLWYRMGQKNFKHEFCALKPGILQQVDPGMFQYR